MIMIAAAPLGTNDDPAERLRLDADFDERWAAWQTRGRVHSRALRHNVLMLGPPVALAAAIAYLFLIP